MTILMGTGSPQEAKRFVPYRFMGRLLEQPLVGRDSSGEWDDGHRVPHCHTLCPCSHYGNFKASDLTNHGLGWFQNFHTRKFGLTLPSPSIVIEDLSRLKELHTTYWKGMHYHADGMPKPLPSGGHGVGGCSAIHHE